ncbi:tripartite tricarboxylate transporter substrate-binding protein [Ottowia thiooxydans]|uniref:tripartite tricarboxylate transporter substrate-binding protein n=1 Tax=Ottowia thiooxydans TaxID=219182 RepID=UPI00040B1D4E|nr:tripartite tricarboxylate transporter substrate-binding protein [Ottowia thiooxydans]
MNLPRQLILATAALLAFSTAPQAQDLKGPVRLIVGYPAGGSADAVARMVAEGLKDEIKTSVVVENRAGAGGQIAADYVRALPGDGTTILVANSHMMVMLPLTSKAVKYDSVADFKPIGRMTSFYEAIALPSSVAATDVKQWIDLAKGDAKLSSFGVPAAGSVSHFIGYKLGADAKVSLQAVPYKGAAPLVQDLLGNQISAGILPILDVAQHSQSGKMRVLAVNGTKRAQLLPEVPTLKELGVSGFDSLEWTALFVPRTTPDATSERLNAALNKVLAQKSVQERLLKLGMESHPSTPAELSSLVSSDLATWRPVVKASGFTID